MFKQITASEINSNIFDLIGKEWMLITAGDKEGFNTMTASWGFGGILWNKPYAACFVRPQRYTREFMDKGEYYTLSFYGEGNPIHKICGSQSGREVDKVKECSLTPVYDQSGAVYFEEARLVIVCRKTYVTTLKEDGFIDKTLIPKNYQLGDFHKVYFGEIVKVLQKV